MSDDFQYDPHTEEGEAARSPDGVTHVAALVGERVVAFCGASLGESERAHEDDVDCMTCVVSRDRFAAGIPR
jgi:hypothetical protein